MNEYNLKYKKYIIKNYKRYQQMKKIKTLVIAHKGRLARFEYNLQTNPFLIKNKSCFLCTFLCYNIYFINYARNKFIFHHFTCTPHKCHCYIKIIIFIFIQTIVI